MSGSLLLTVRRLAIFVILLFAYMYYRSAGEAQLFAIGILAFAAIAQFAPAFFGGLLWRRGTARGAIAGMTVGIVVWAYTLLLPTFAEIGFVGQSVLTAGPWGIDALRPQTSVRVGPAAAGPRRDVEPWRSIFSAISASRSGGRRHRSSACRPMCSCPRIWRR